MTVVYLKPEDVKDDQSAEKASWYKLHNITSSGAIAVVDTGEALLVTPTIFPIPLIVPLTTQTLDIDIDILRGEDELAEGYKAMAEENIRLAEEFLPVALEEWPMWEA